MDFKSYEYLDGSANQYIIKAELTKTIEYIPVKPLYSSSGIYDGGEYVKKEITTSQYSDILSLLHDAIGKRDIHIKDRVKLSGMIIINDKGNRDAYILNPDSEEKSLIEKKLREFIEI